MLQLILTFFFLFTSYFVGRIILSVVRIQLGNLAFVASIVLGIMGITIIWFVGGHLLPFTQPVLTGILVLMMILSLWRLKKPFVLLKKDASSLFKEHVTPSIVTTLFLVFLVLWLFGRALFVSPDGDIVAGDRLVWVDWPLHIAMASSFTWGDNLPPQNPTFAGIPLIYPFMADFVSGAFLALGSSLPWAFAAPAVVLTVCFFFLYLGFGKQFFDSVKVKTDSYARALAFGSLFLCLFWGGMGWWYWLSEAFANQTTLIETLVLPPREYTFWGEKGLWFFTFLFSEILPQRAFLFGLPLFFLVLWLLKTGWEKRRKPHFVLAGVLAGISPFFHTHTFLSLIFFTVTLFGIGLPAALRKPLENKRKYFEALFLFFVPFGLLALIQLPLFLGQHREFPFVFGWMKENENFFLFWFKNTGFFIPLALLGLLKGKFANHIKLAGLASWILFVLPNLFRFAPWGYDNLKILTFWYLLNAFFVMYALYLIWQKLKVIGPFVSILLFVSLTLSGVVEVGRILDTGRVQLQLWSAQDQAFASEVRNHTEPDAVFLTAAIHDHPVASLAGRKIVLGFPGNSWSWGIDGWSEREQDVHGMFRGEQNALDLFKKYRISYIIVSDRERNFEPDLNEAFIKENSEIVFQTGTTTVYKIKHETN